MALSTTQYGYIIDPMVPFTDDKGKTIKNGFVRVFVAGSSTPVVTYRNFDGATNQDRIELDNSGRTMTSVIGSKGLTYKVCVYDQHHSQESPILTVDKVSVIGANITAGTGATVVTGLDGLKTKPDGFVDASVVGTDGYVALDHTLVTDDLDTDAKATAVEDDRYIPLLNDDVNDPDSKMTLGRLWQWVLGKIKSLSTTITAFRTSDYIAVDGPSGTAKMSKDDLLKETAENALAGNLAPAFDPTKDYKIGDEVINEAKRYRFVLDHPAGAWNSSHVYQISSSVGYETNFIGTFKDVRNVDTTFQVTYDYPVMHFVFTKVDSAKYVACLFRTNLREIINEIENITITIRNNTNTPVNMPGGLFFTTSQNDWSTRAYFKDIVLDAYETKELNYFVDAGFRTWATNTLNICIRDVAGLAMLSGDLSVCVHTDRKYMTAVPRAILADSIIGGIPVSTISNFIGTSSVATNDSSAINNISYKHPVMDYVFSRASGKYNGALFRTDLVSMLTKCSTINIIVQNNDVNDITLYGGLSLTISQNNWSQRKPISDIKLKAGEVRTYSVNVTSELIAWATDTINVCIRSENTSSLSGNLSLAVYTDAQSLKVVPRSAVADKVIDSAEHYITCWGDSLTRQGGWTDIVASALGMNLYNCGVGGEKSTTIMARQGGDIMLVDGVTIPADTSAVKIGESTMGTYFGESVTPLLQSGGEINSCKLGDIDGTFSISGSDYYFARSVGGSAVTIDRPTALRTKGDIEYNTPYLMIIFMGQNGGWGTDYEHLIWQHKKMIEHTLAEHVVVLGLSSGSASYRADYENAMRAEFGRYFISLREYLAHPIYTGGVITNCYGLADAGLTPTSADLDDIAVGKVPAQCLTDGTHFTSATKTVIGNMLVKKLAELNIIK